MIKATERVSKAAKASGIHWGTVSGTPDHTRKLLELGGRFICHGADIVMVKRGLEQIQQNYAPLGFTFDNRIAAMTAELEKSSENLYSRK
jgi:4-hydroxy-2-oxoheptanedioate aldolase